MTFSDFLQSLSGVWVTVWTTDTSFDPEGRQGCFVGRLVLHEDFIEIIDPDGDNYGVQLSHVTGIVRRSQSEQERMTVLSLEKKQGQAMGTA